MLFRTNSKKAKNINSSDGFLEDENSLEKLDSISMRLLAIRERFKNIDNYQITNF